MSATVTFRHSVEIIDGKLRHLGASSQPNSSCNSRKTATTRIQIFRGPAIGHQSFDIWYVGTEQTDCGKIKGCCNFRIWTSWSSVARLLPPRPQSDARNSLSTAVKRWETLFQDMKSFGWSELHSVKAPGSKLAGIEDDVKREIVDLMVSRKGAARGKMQPLFAYHLNPALHDPRGEVVKTNILVFLWNMVQLWSW